LCADLIDTAEHERGSISSLAKLFDVVNETLYAWRRKRRGRRDAAPFDNWFRKTREGAAC
jgi:transposase-like protein